MNTDEHGLKALLIHLCLSVFICGFITSAADARNVLLIVADDYGPDGGCFGNDAVVTPNLDKLAGESTRFSHAFATVASCSPSRAVLLTGLYTHQNGQYGLAHAAHNQATKAPVQSLPGVLRGRGYRTAILGKNHVQPESVYPYETILKSAGGNRGVVVMAGTAGEFMAAGGEPFFLVVGFSDPHRAGSGFANDAKYAGVTPRTYDPASVRVPPHLPDDPAVRADIADYYESISRLDQGVGALMAELERAGKRDDTLVVFTSDNGMPFPGAKTNLYDAAIRLPLIVRVPGKRGGVVSRGMASWIDVAPTVLEYADAPPPKNLPGRSLLPIVEQENPDGWDAVFASHVMHEITMYYPMRAVRTRTHKLVWNLAHQLPYPIAGDLEKSPSWLACKRLGTTVGGRTLDQYLHRPAYELFDLEKDPHEMKNVADDPAYAEVLKDLKSRLTARLNETNDPWLEGGE
jgi:N-sulfoglucosamine sulfohydrolase